MEQNAEIPNCNTIKQLDLHDRYCYTNLQKKV